MRRFKEWLSIRLAKNPGQMVLVSVLLFNVFFFLLSALIISNLSLEGTEKMTFLEAAFCTVTMILDAGCIQFVVADIGTAGVATVIICLSIVVIGMISFTGAVIGYITNYISTFIESSNTGSRCLRISDHVVLLNWNTRASEIVNDLLFCNTPQKVVVLVNSRKAEIEKEIQERLADTVKRENEQVARSCENMGYIAKAIYKQRHKFKNNLTVVVREGDVFSSKQLHDISLERAKTVIILGNDLNNSTCKFEQRERVDEKHKGNPQTIKTLMQVADITSAAYSDDNQKIVVEVTDDWTADIVDKIIISKTHRNGEETEKCNIVPVRVNLLLGHILSQFSLMPELNTVYTELFSNKGATFFTKELTEREGVRSCDDLTVEKEIPYVADYIRNHKHSLPLAFMKSGDKPYCYYVSTEERFIDKACETSKDGYTVSVNKNYWIERKNVIILGHNSRCNEIMQSFRSFTEEWKLDNGKKILNIVVIDDERHLQRMDYYKAYSDFVVQTVTAEIYEREKICKAIERFVDSNEEDTSVLILSDDSAPNEDIDANALANLVYIKDIIRNKKENDPDFDEYSIDVVVEIIDPKHHDVVNSYSVNNIVISNRYISKMITQIGEKEALFEFYTDILEYDSASEGDAADAEYDSKEIYVKKVSSFFDELPEECNAMQFVKALYDATNDESLPYKKRTPAIALGYVEFGGKTILFSGDLTKIPVKLQEKDKLIVFSNH